jgi:hypothetical protein
MTKKHAIKENKKRKNDQITKEEEEEKEISEKKIKL